MDFFTTARSETSVDNAYAVAVIGFKETERIVLRSMFWLSSRSQFSFEQFDPEQHLSPDLYVVDADAPESKETLASIISDRATHTRPIILIGSGSLGTAYPLLAKPLRVTRILSAFESALNVNRTRAQKSGGVDQVLVVDDSLPVRKFMELKLAPYSFGVDFADSGEMAISLAAQRDYACIFLDVMLPGLDGYQVCKAIKKEKGSSTSVVMLTGKSSSFDKIRGTMAGCDAYMTKPVDEEKLMEVIAKFVPQREGARAASAGGRAS